MMAEHRHHMPGMAELERSWALKSSSTNTKQKNQTRNGVVFNFSKSSTRDRPLPTWFCSRSLSTQHHEVFKCWSLWRTSHSSHCKNQRLCELLWLSLEPHIMVVIEISTPHLLSAKYNVRSMTDSFSLMLHIIIPI